MSISEPRRGGEPKRGKEVGNFAARCPGAGVAALAVVVVVVVAVGFPWVPDGTIEFDCDDDPTARKGGHIYISFFNTPISGRLR